MIFVLNKLRDDIFDVIQTLGGPEDKSVLLTSDAVNYATPFMIEKFKPYFVEDIYVAKDALEARNIDIAPECEVVDYDEMVTLLLDEDEKVLAI